MPYWDYDEEPWRQWMQYRPAEEPEQQPQFAPPQPQWGLSDWWGQLTEPISRGWQEGGWLSRILGPIAQPGYWAERGLGALEERAPDWLATGFAQAADWTRWLTPGGQIQIGQELAGAPPKPTAQEQVAQHLRDKGAYFDFVNSLPEETQSIINRETRRINYSGYDARLAAAQQIIQGNDYTPEGITGVLKEHEKFWPELVGNIIFDPLNFAGAVLKPLGLGKAGRQAIVGTRAMEAVEFLPELGRIDQVKDWLLTPLSKSLDDQGAFMVYLNRAAANSDEAGELITKLQRLKNPDELAGIFADVADKDRIFLSETSRRKFLTHLDNIDLDAIDIAEKGVSDVVDDIAGILPDVTDTFHGVGPASALERFNRRVKSIIGIPLIGMNPAVASKNIINAAVTGVWDEGAMPLAETLKALPSRGDSIRNAFIQEGLTPEHIDKWIFRGFAGVPETGAVGGLIGKIAIPGRVMRFMERFQGAATFRAGYLKTWDALYGNIAPQLTPEIIQQLGPHADDFRSLIRHSNPGNVQDKVAAFLKAIESPEAVAKPLAAYVDQLPQGIAAHWEEMLAPWAKEGLEIEGKSLGEVLEMFRQMGSRVDADAMSKAFIDDILGKMPEELAGKIKTIRHVDGLAEVSWTHTTGELALDLSRSTEELYGDIAHELGEAMIGRDPKVGLYARWVEFLGRRGIKKHPTRMHEDFAEAVRKLYQSPEELSDDVVEFLRQEGITGELKGFGDDLFDGDGWLRGRDRMWPEVAPEIPGEMPTRPFPGTVSPEAYPLLTDSWSELVGRLKPSKKLLQGWLDEAAELGHTPGGAFIKRGPTTGAAKWSWLHDRGRFHVWNRLVEWGQEAGKADDLVELGARAVDPGDFARRFIDEDILSAASGATETPTLSHVARVQQKTARSIFEELERIITADLQKPRGIAADVGDFVDSAVLPAMSDAQTGSLMVADLIRNDVMLNYTRRMRFDPWMDLVFPYHFWFDRSAGNWLRRIMTSPAQAALYAKLRAHIIERDRDLPSRLQGSLPFVVDKILPNWAVNMIFLNPEKALIPFPSIFKEKGYERPAEQLTPLGRGVEQIQETGLDIRPGEGEFRLPPIPMYPSPLIQYPLALTGALGAPEQWVSGPQTPPGRYMRAISGTGWGREALGGLGQRALGPEYEVPPTGINIEAPLLRMAGIQEVPTWEKEYWPLKHIALMAERGEITEDEAVEAMRTQSGDLWEEAQRRTTYQKAWPTLTGALGFPAKIQPGMEQEVRFAKREQQEAESYERYREYFEEHPGIGLTSLAWQMAGGEDLEERAKEWLQWYDYRQYKEDRDTLVDEFITENPGDTKGLGEITKALRALRPAIPDREFQRHFKMTDEEWDEALSSNLIWRTQDFAPDYEDFEEYGYGQYDAYQAAMREFYGATETADTPWMQEIVYEAARTLWIEEQIVDYREENPDDVEGQRELRDTLRMAVPEEADLDLGEAESLIISLIGGEEGIKRQFREYDSPLEAAQRIYKDAYINAAYEARDKAYEPWNKWQEAREAAGYGEEFQDEIGPLWDYYHTLPSGTGERSAFLRAYPELLEYQDFKDQYQETHPEAVWETVEAAAEAVGEGFGPIDAIELIPQILKVYKERGWTEEELREVLGAPVEPTGEMPAGITEWDGLISEVAREFGLPAGYEPIIAAIMDIESRGKAGAVNATSGATGLMQIMPMHFEEGKNPKDPRWNIRKGVEILVDNIERTGGDFETALFYYSGRADRPREPFIREYWEPFLERLERFGGVGEQVEELRGLTFPGFAAYREMQRREPGVAQREAPTAQGVAAPPAVGRPEEMRPEFERAQELIRRGWIWNEHFGFYHPRVPRRQLTSWGGDRRKGKRWKRGKWWDRSVLGTPFTWRV